MINVNKSVEIIRRLANSNEKYLEAKMISNGDGNLTEILEDGDLYIMSMMPNVTSKEVKDYQKDYPMYFFERNSMGAILLNNIRIEMTINPSYYRDDRFKKLLEKDVVVAHCMLIDSRYDVVVAANVVEIKGRQLEYLKKCFLLNSTMSKYQYNNWIDDVLYAKSFNENIKRSMSIGKAYKSSNIEMIII